MSDKWANNVAQSNAALRLGKLDTQLLITVFIRITTISLETKQDSIVLHNHLLCRNDSSLKNFELGMETRANSE